MNPPDWSSCREEELWKFVSFHLAKNSIETVLVGGAVVAIYTGGLYQSGDLDLIVTNFFKDGLPTVMASLGFRKKGRHFFHPLCQHLFVEFPAGPLGIGDDVSIQPDKVLCEGVEIKILSPSDCIKDRLASYLFFQDQEGLSQAVLVAQHQAFDHEAVRAWCQRENALPVWEKFAGLLSENQG